MKAIIMAGGKGTRLKPLTDNIPKPLVKIIDKPVMEHIINLLKTHGISKIGVTLGFKADDIVNYFGNGKNFGVEITYFVEDEPLGTAGSIKNARSFASSDFIVISGDSYTNLDLTKAIEFHKAKQSPFTIVATPHNNPKGLGVLDIDFEGKLNAFIEKPDQVKPSLINTGIYIMNKRTINLIPDGFYDFGRQLIPRLINKAYVMVTYDYWSDIGTLPSYYYTNYLISQTIYMN